MSDFEMYATLYSPPCFYTTQKNYKPSKNAIIFSTDPVDIFFSLKIHCAAANAAAW